MYLHTINITANVTYDLANAYSSVNVRLHVLCFYKHVCDILVYISYIIRSIFFYFVFLFIQLSFYIAIMIQKLDKIKRS